MLANAELRVRPELLAAPELPALIAQTHRRGERFVVRVPLESRRHGWRWTLTPHPEQRRLVAKNFDGETLDRWPEPRVLFGAPGGREEMRRLMAEAQRYVLATRDAGAAISD